MSLIEIAKSTECRYKFAVKRHRGYLTIFCTTGKVRRAERIVCNGLAVLGAQIVSKFACGNADSTTLYFYFVNLNHKDQFVRNI